METFTLKVIGFSRVFYEGEASQVQLPIQDGSMGIMAHHETAVIGIVPGTMRLQTPDGEWQSAVVDAGFARVGENTVSVMVEEVRLQRSFAYLLGEDLTGSLHKLLAENGVKVVKGVKNMLFGGEGLFDTVITGPGKVFLQTMTISKLANQMVPYLPFKK